MAQASSCGVGFDFDVRRRIVASAAMIRRKD